MIDVEPLVREELDRLVPGSTAVRADWQDVRRRAAWGSRRRGLLATALAAALVAGVAVSPLGGSISSRLEGFSQWLTGTPGEDAAPVVQRAFEQANRFPGGPRLRQLLKVEVDGRTFYLHGFETRQVVCLRVAVSAREGAGPEAACVSRADLRRSGDLVLPVKANLSVGHVGPLPRTADDPPTVPKYLLTFGIAAAEVTKVVVETDRGTSAAAVRNGAFLDVFVPGRRGAWARSIRATVRGGRTQVVPISVHVSGQPALRTGLRPQGPATVERPMTSGSIGWFARREARGVSARAGGLRNCCIGFVRVIYPDPDDFLAVAVGDKTLLSLHAPRRARLGEDTICVGLISRGGVGTGCRDGERLFDRGPLALSWGFSGGGQQNWIVSGVASDDVDRIEVFLGNGERWRAPLRDNATAFRIQRAKFPARLVGYDDAGRVIGVETIRG
ncbi:MAG: hypothetical protein H0V68_11520 [Actinobacteria bacterium]|nr:hypothetical protein [Actinomycetota bacterium]